MAPLIISRGPKINELNKPLIAPAIPPIIPPSAKPSNAPLIVSNRVRIINSGKNTLEAILATAPTALPKVDSDEPIPLKKPLILPKILTDPFTELIAPFSILNKSPKGFANPFNPFKKPPITMGVLPNPAPPLNIPVSGLSSVLKPVLIAVPKPLMVPVSPLNTPRICTCNLAGVNNLAKAIIVFSCAANKPIRVPKTTAMTLPNLPSLLNALSSSPPGPSSDSALPAKISR